MRTAQEWSDERWAHFERGVSLCDYYKAIQADAYRAGLLRAAQVCLEQTGICEAFVVEKIVTAIEAEAESKKGLP